jgi:hypothetical protein
MLIFRSLKNKIEDEIIGKIINFTGFSIVSLGLHSQKLDGR